MPGKGFNVVVKIDLRKTLKNIANKKDITVQNLVDSILREWLEGEGEL